jgi:hypothetical protein
MSSQQSTLLSLASFFERNDLPYMVMGGLANIVWGEPRATLDIDVTILVEDSRIEAVVHDLVTEFHALAGDPLEFVRDTRVLPLESDQGVRIDVVFGLLPFERAAIARAVPVEFAGVAVRFCTPEDLILMKILSERERDLTDAEKITHRRLGELDLEYLEPRIRELADLLAKPEIMRRWESWKAKATGSP